MHGLPDIAPTIIDLAECRDFTIGGASVSPSTRTIRGPGGNASVEPRVMQVLVTLAGSAGRVLSRDALYRRCWGGVFVGEDSLNRAIGQIRRIGRTVAAGSFAVETIPRTGYRLVAGDPGRGFPAGRSTVEQAGAETRRGAMPPGWRLALGGGLLAAAGGLGYWLGRPGQRDRVEAARLATTLVQTS